MGKTLFAPWTSPWWYGTSGKCDRHDESIMPLHPAMLCIGCRDITIHKFIGVHSCKTINCSYLSRGVIDNFLCSQIALVSDKKLVHVFAGIAIDFLQPLLDVVERLLCQQAEVNHPIRHNINIALHTLRPFNTNT